MSRSPYFLTFGRKITTEVDLLAEEQIEDEDVKTWFTNLKLVRKQAKKEVSIQKIKSKEYKDKGANISTLP